MKAFNPRRAAAISLGRATRALSRGLGRGGGTSLPGLVAMSVDPDVLGSLSAQLPQGAILVTGTNGKTTTCRLLANALGEAGLSPIYNREGANLLRGVATMLLARADWQGNLASGTSDIGLFELDEGAFTRAIGELEPRLVLINNLFRDQLDGYFEVDYLASLWAEALRGLPPGAAAVLNADDPQVAYLGKDIPGRVVYFGLEDKSYGREGLEHASDSRRCLACGADYRYEFSFYAHLGHYSCPRCGWSRPQPQVRAVEVKLKGLSSSYVRIKGSTQEIDIHLPLPGFYNIYNVLAMAAVVEALGLDLRLAKAAAEKVQAAFGRLEHFTMEGRRVYLILAKNPSGFNEVLRMLLADEELKGLVFYLNDNIPDGRDVSWIWDVDFELLKGRLDFCVASGIRSYDMAMRLKYAELFSDRESGGELIVEEDFLGALRLGLERIPKGGTLCVVPTYSAMLDLRARLSRQGLLEPFWA